MMGERGECYSRSAEKRHTVMERTIFLQHYRICLRSDGTPRELSRDGAAITYEAVDERSREPVDLKLIPLQNIDPDIPGQLEEQARAAQNLRHVNIPKVQAEDSQTREEAPPAEQFATSEQLPHGTTDVRSEIYSLGATLYFLLTGVALSADALQRPPKFSGFPKALRSLLGRMLHRDPDQRPKDLVVLAETIRECLLKIERRRTLADKYGIPYRTTIPRRPEARPERLLRIALPVAALLLATAVIAAVLFSEPIGRIMHGNRETEKVGVLIGVPESSPPQPAQNASAKNSPAIVASQEANPAVPNATQPPVNVATASNSP